MSEQTATPSSHWRAEGQADPHAGHYDCERAALAMGNLTDDQLANAAFMFYNDYPSLQDVLDGKAFQPIAYMTAVKDRIRWLSRSLEKVTAELAAVRESRDVMSECHRINVAERDSRIKSLYSQLAASRKQPIVGVVDENEDGLFADLETPEGVLVKWGDRIYAHPAPVRKLTDETINSMHGRDGDKYAFARAIERYLSGEDE